jgi:hypothetical protein
MRNLSIEIRRSELCTIRALFAPWELPLLQMVHGMADVAVKGEVDNDVPYPTSAAAEYARLAQVYGTEEGENHPRVTAAYGGGQGGHMALGTKIRQFIAEMKARAPKAPPPDVVAADEDDMIENGDRIDADAIGNAPSVLDQIGSDAAVAADPLLQP